MEGPSHGGMRLVELTWLPSDGVEAGAFLDKWFDVEKRKKTKLPVILTVRLRAARAASMGARRRAS